jgi:hypothetical protein
VRVTVHGQRTGFQVVAPDDYDLDRDGDGDGLGCDY